MKKKLLSVFTAAALSLSCFIAVPIVSQAVEYTSGDYAYSRYKSLTWVQTDPVEYTSGDYTYTLEYGGTITGYNGSDTNVVIPSELDGNTVLTIGYGAFKDNTNITSVVIPYTVQTISSYSFQNCSNLSKVDLGNGVSNLSSCCFQNCDSLTSINIPASMTTGAAKAGFPFKDCDALKTATIASGGVKIPYSLFAGCSALQEVNIPEGIQTFELNAFSGCTSLEEIKIPNSVQTIGAAAFSSCSSLKEIILPESIREIQPYAFTECISLKDFYDYGMETDYQGYVFEKVPSLTIHGFEGSNAQKYANSNNHTFVILTDVPPTDKTEEEKNRLFEDTDWDSFSSRYYYRQMNDAQKRLYDALYEECMECLTTTKNCENSCTESVRYDDSISGSEIFDIVCVFIRSNPQFYFLSGASELRSRQYEDGIEYSVFLKVYEDFKYGVEREQSTKQFISTINGYIDTINQKTTDYEKERTAHDIIASRLSYDSHSKYKQSSASAFLTTESVCAGYSQGLELLLNGVGLECIPVCSDGVGSHEWLQVMIDGIWYGVDVTWDDTNDEISDRFFNVSDETMCKEDRIDASHIPGELYTSLNRPVCKYDYGHENLEDIKGRMYRLYNNYSGEHFYTCDIEEKNNLVSLGWTYEGIAWISPTSSKTPVYRLYNPNSGEHHYTIDANEKGTLASYGWKEEGIGWYSNDDQGTPLYRLYNPNAAGQYEAGGHHYTKNVSEKNSLIAAGWRDEGIGWYGL